MSSHVTTCHACHGYCTLSPLNAALTMVFAKNPQRDTSEVLCLPLKMTMEVSSSAPATKSVAHLLKTTQKCCACHTKRLSTRLQTRENITKCHACHAKRGCATSETSKSDRCCKNRRRHGHSDLTRTVANGCATSGKHSLNPQTPRVKQEPLLRIREKVIGHTYARTCTQTDTRAHTHTHIYSYLFTPLRVGWPPTPQVYFGP